MAHEIGLIFDLLLHFVMMPHVKFKSVVSRMCKMEDLLLKFPHIGTKIFEELDNENVTLCRTVTSPWKSFIDGQKFLWIRKIQRYIPKSKDDLKKLLKFINIEDVKQIENIAQTAERNVFSCEEYSILHFSAMSGNTDVFRNVYKRSSEKCPKDHWNNTPLLYAAKYGHFDLCQFILKNTDDKDLIHYDMIRVLYTAAGRGNFQMFKYVFDMIEDKNPADAIGWTPLHSAAAKGHFSICDLILENVEEKDPKTKHDIGNGRTPYDFAKSNGHFKICQLIKNSKDKVDHHMQMLASGDFHKSVVLQEKQD